MLKNYDFFRGYTVVRNRSGIW